jgi:hypothetical protein
MVLSQHLHLFHIEAPSEACVSINLDYKNYSHIFMKLDQSSLNTAEIIGVSEQMAMKMVVKPSFTESQVMMLKLFFKVYLLSMHASSSKYFARQIVIYHNF